MKNTKNQEGTFAIIAAIIVLFSSMWSPMTSVIISILFLLGFAVWEFSKK